MPNPTSAVLAAMNRRSCTLGWDVLVAYNAASVNDLFAAQYVADMREQQNFPPINDTLTLGNTVTVEVDDLVLGPPQISFSPNTTDQEAVVTLNFVSGSILQVLASGDVTYVTGAQNIVPGDAYELRMTVPLDQVSGSVATDRDVTLNLKNATTATANLLPGTTAASYLGQYFTTLFGKSGTGGLSYQLGTLVVDSSDNLTPTSFQIRTQVYPGTQGPEGAVLLFVATKYNQGGGALPGADFPYLIPDGNTCTLVVASKTLFENILSPYYTATMKGSPTFEIDQFPGSSPASFMVATGGSLPGPQVSGSWSSGPAVGYSVWSGSCGYNGQTNVSVPYKGWTFEPDNDQLSITWNNASFDQSFAGQSTMRDSFCTSSDVTLTLNASMKAVPTVSNQLVSLTRVGSPTVNFAFQSSSWFSKVFGNGDFRDNAAATLSNSIKPLVATAMEVPIPQVDAFAVGHLFFPGANALSYSSAHLPGDLALFGRISPRQTLFAVTPLQVVLGPGETQQFSVSNGDAVEWTIYPAIGGISDKGLYTAPSSIAAGIPVAVTATDGQQGIASGLVIVVPSAVSISPSFSIVLADTKPLPLQAAVLGNAAASWSISPADGSAGTVSQTGVYTPPAPFPGVLMTAVVTAAAAGTAATSLICLANVSIAITLTPMCARLGPDDTQQFSAGEGSDVQWSVHPPIGNVSPDGLYTAPAEIGQPCTVLVVADSGGFYGFAPVFLTQSVLRPKDSPVVS